MANKTVNIETEVDNVSIAAPRTDFTNLESNASAKLNALESRRKKLAEVYMKEPKVPVTISPFYKPHFGSVVPVLVNGILVNIPADGRTYQINKTHADEIIAKIRKIDILMDRQRRAADVSNNYERNIGELQI